MKYLSLNIPGYGQLEAPEQIPTGGFIDSGTGNNIISWAISIAFIIAVILVLALIVWGGLQWVTSGSDKEKVSGARNRIVYAVIGLVILFLSVLIVNLILYFLGVNNFSEIGTSTCPPAC